MADTKITDLNALGAKPDVADVLVVVDNPGGAAETKKITFANLTDGVLHDNVAAEINAIAEKAAPIAADLVLIEDSAAANAKKKVQIGNLVDLASIYSVCNGRLTLTTGVPVTTANVTAATTLYFTPYKGDRIGLYDGAAWSIETFTERSISILATTTQMYDVFLYDNAGTLTLELTAWTNDTTRATALATQDGIYVKTGATTRRYLGSIRTTGVSGQCEDSESKRYVWNMYNRLLRQMFVEKGNSHTYGTATYRYWNNDNTMKVEMVLGVAQSVMSMVYATIISDSTNNGRVALPYDVSNANGRSGVSNKTVDSVEAGNGSAQSLAVGYHYAAVVEWAEGGTPTFSAAGAAVYVWG